jgi:hypothetical protein
MAIPDIAGVALVLPSTRKKRAKDRIAVGRDRRLSAYNAATYGIVVCAASFEDTFDEFGETPGTQPV